MTTAIYFAFAGALFVFGVITGFSIGIPFLLLGQLLAVLYPLRWKPVFWVVILGYAAFWIGFILVTPLSCTAMAVARTSSFERFPGPIAGSGRVVCSNLLGIDYSGGFGYSPPRRYAFAAGLATSSITVTLAWISVGAVARRFRRKVNVLPPAS